MSALLIWVCGELMSLYSHSRLVCFTSNDAKANSIITKQGQPKGYIKSTAERYQFLFLDAASHLFQVCPSVKPFIGLSVDPSEGPTVSVGLFVILSYKFENAYFDG